MGPSGSTGFLSTRELRGAGYHAPRPSAGRTGDAGSQRPSTDTSCASCLAVFPLQLAGPAGGNAADPSSPPVCLIQGLLLLLRGGGGRSSGGRG